jgi:hypothetical protein
VLVDAESPPAPVADYVRVLGEPGARLDHEELDEVDRGAELVWPARGIVIITAGETGASRIGLFPPQSIDDYQRHARVIDRTRIEP